MLLEPEPHIPDIPDVFIPEDVDTPDDVDIPLPDDVDTPGIGMVPGSTAAAGGEAPAAVPPPSYIAVDPYISEGEVATVEHAVPLLVVGMVIVPAKPVGPGLTPPDLISVEPSGIPVGELAEPIPMPSGEVAPIVGVGSTVLSTCAMATLPAKNAGRTAATSEILTGFKFATPRRGSFTTISVGARLSDIGQSLDLRWSRLGA
jgi:hypothetical protein